MKGGRRVFQAAGRAYITCIGQSRRTMQSNLGKIKKRKSGSAT
jgi:hypothetical protein